MTEQHPITPSPELVQQWFDDFAPKWFDDFAPKGLLVFAIQAARWGADQELEACEKWLSARTGFMDSHDLHNARRPKPPSLAEQALAELERTVLLLMPVTGPNKVKRLKTIRAALERLQELEEGND